jgi:hypothetical protein
MIFTAASIFYFNKKGQKERNLTPQNMEQNNDALIRVDGQYVPSPVK